MESYRRKLEIELEERRSEIAQTQEIETLLARQLVEVAQRKSEAEESAAHARIAMEQSIEEAGLRRQQAVREQQIKQAYGIEIAEQDHKIALSEKQIEGSKDAVDSILEEADGYLERLKASVGMEGEAAAEGAEDGTPEVGEGTAPADAPGEASGEAAGESAAPEPTSTS